MSALKTWQLRLGFTGITVQRIEVRGITSDWVSVQYKRRFRVDSCTRAVEVIMN